jgi:hypothetical protein
MVSTYFCLELSEQNDIFRFLKISDYYHFIGQIAACRWLHSHTWFQILVPHSNIFLSHDSESHVTAPPLIGRKQVALYSQKFPLELFSGCSLRVHGLSWHCVLISCVRSPLDIGDSFMLFLCKSCFKALSRPSSKLRLA